MSIGLRVLHGKFGRRITLKFALAGGTSPLAKDLADSLLASGHDVEIFSRSASDPSIRGYEDLEAVTFDALVNLMGGHATNMTDGDVASILSISEDLVNCAMNRQVPLIHVSSGSVLGPLNEPALPEQPRVSDHFATRYQEVKVRIEQLHDLNRHIVPISDLRLFSFAGPHFLRESDYFLAKLSRAAKEKVTLRVEGAGFLRDFTGPHELASAIEIASMAKYSGTANLFSDQPASRSEILDLFQEQFGLSFDAKETLPSLDVYCASKKVGLPSFTPRRSIEVISQECAIAFV
ncbi:MAG: dependent epimerase/dehydratase family [Actinomycetota bacterium]|jgi:nucleoside-diphosphate-sugar epimerase